MKFIPQKLPGVWLIEPTPFKDERGVFRRNFCAREFAAHGIASHVLQSNISENNHALTLRGFHYQLAPHGEGKTLTCLRGKIHDIVVDLRPDSPSYLKWIEFELDDQNRKSIHIPPGCANAFLTLTDEVIVSYLFSEFYQPGSEAGIRWDDPLFGFRWPETPLHLSKKDAELPDFIPTQRP
jgi:dTDP-4-dehydrorhamnose 3,5-epimerase